MEANMAKTTVAFNPELGNPQVEVIIGQAQIGTYRLFLWNKEGKQSELIGEGTSNDNTADIFNLPSVEQLEGRYFTWDGLVTSTTKTPGQFYSFTVLFKQDGTTVTDGMFSEAGELAGTQPIHGQICFESK